MELSTICIRSTEKENKNYNKTINRFIFYVKKRI